MKRCRILIHNAITLTLRLLIHIEFFHWTVPPNVFTHSNLQFEVICYFQTFVYISADWKTSNHKATFYMNTSQQDITTVRSRHVPILYRTRAETSFILHFSNNTFLLYTQRAQLKLSNPLLCDGFYLPFRLFDLSWQIFPICLVISLNVSRGNVMVYCIQHLKEANIA